VNFRSKVPVLFASVLLAGSNRAQGADPQVEPGAGDRFGFSSSRSVEGTLAETAEAQEEGVLEKFRARKKSLEARTGFTYGFDNITHYLGTDSDK